jgi:hypothetical protein
MLWTERARPDSDGRGLPAVTSLRPSARQLLTRPRGRDDSCRTETRDRRSRWMRLVGWQRFVSLSRTERSRLGEAARLRDRSRAARPPGPAQARLGDWRSAASPLRRSGDYRPACVRGRGERRGGVDRAARSRVAKRAGPPVRRPDDLWRHHDHDDHVTSGDMRGHDRRCAGRPGERPRSS